SSGDRSAVAQPIAGLPLRPGGSGPVRFMIVALLVAGMTMPLPGETPPSPLGPDTASSRTEIRVETSASHEALPADRCQVAQQATHRSCVTSWSRVGEVRPRDGEGLELVRAASHCGAGALPGESSGAGLGPFLILETSATPVWDPGPMDPGSVAGVQIALVVTARQLTGFSPEGKALYRGLATDRRTIRLEEGEEFVLPVALADDHARGVPGIREVFRAGWAERPGATESGSVWIMGAAPRSKIIVDGGTSGGRRDRSAQYHPGGAAGGTVARSVATERGSHGVGHQGKDCRGYA